MARGLPASRTHAGRRQSFSRILGRIWLGRIWLGRIWRPGARVAIASLIVEAGGQYLLWLAPTPPLALAAQRKT